jgi:hypothetical protein
MILNNPASVVWYWEALAISIDCGLGLRPVSSAMERLLSQYLEAENQPSASVKSFGRRQAYESPRGRNPRATVGGYGDFDLGLISAMARPRPGSGVLDADRPLRCASARFSRPGSRLDATLLAAIITMNARGSVAGGGAPAAEVWIMPCRVMKQSPGSSPSHPAVRAAASGVRTPR